MKVGLGWTVAIVVGSVSLGSLVACGGNGDDGDVNPPSITHEEAEVQYLEEAANWELPSDWDWPEGPLYTGVGPDGVSAVYAPDIGSVDATWYWYCAWSHTLIEASSDGERSDAVDQLLRFPETASYRAFLPDGRERMDLMLDAVAAGDYSGPATDVELNCPGRPR